MSAKQSFHNVLALVAILLSLIGSTAAVARQQTTQAAIDTDIELLANRLAQQQPPVQIAAARRLAELGKQAKPAQESLIKCLQDSNSDLRVVSCYALARISDDPTAAIKALLPILNDNNEHVRYSAQWSIAQLVLELTAVSEDAACDQLVQLLEQVVAAFKAHEHQARHRNVVESVLASIRSQSVQPESTTASAKSSELVEAQQLVEGLYEPNDIMSRLLIIRRLQDSQKFPSLIRQRVLLVEAVDLEYGLLEYAVARWGDLAQAELVNILSKYDQTTEIPVTLAALIDQVIPAELSMLTRLKKWSRDSRTPDEIRLACLNAITRSTYDVPGCVEWLSFMLNEPELQIAAADALAEMGPRAASVQTQLMSALIPSRDESFQISGILAIAAIAPESSLAAQYIVQWLKVTPNDSTTLPLLLDACEEFGELAQSAIPLIRQHLKDNDPQVRISALRALRGMPFQAGPALPELLSILSSTEERVSIKNRASRVVAKMGPEAVRQVISSLTSATQLGVQEDLLRSLAVTGPVANEAVSLCATVLENKNAPLSLRMAAANVIGTVGKSAQHLAPQLLAHCNQNEEESLYAICLLSAARINAAATLATAQASLANRSRAIRASAAYAACLAGESRAGFETLLDLLSDGESDVVIKESLEELGEYFGQWFVEEAENSDRTDVERLACCELACQLDAPNWARLVYLVDDPALGQEFTERLSWFWHPEIADQLGQHLAEVDSMLDLFQSNKLSLQGRARLASLLLPDGLGAGDDEGQWSGIALSRAASMELLQQSESYQSLAGVSGEEAVNPEPMPEAAPEPAPKKMAQREPTNDSNKIAVIPSPTTTDVLVASSAVLPSIKEIEVFYGTNRQRDTTAGNMREYVIAILVTTLGCVLTLLITAVGSFVRGGRIVGLLAVVGLLVFGAVGLLTAMKLTNHPVQSLVAYNHRVSELVEYGRCKVTLPPIHQPGMVEAPMLFKGELIADPNKHVMLANVDQLTHDQFLDDLKSMQAKKGKNLLVFIHGYNVSFEDAAKRTAQMAYDVDFPGAAVFYSWPSQADWYGYESDRRRIERSVMQIRSFLEDLAARSGATSINIVAHSMGNVGLTAALKDIATPTKEPIFNQVVLAAPDIDAEVFKRDIAPFIVSKAKRTTLYTSKTDLALIASRYFNDGARLGDSGSEVVTYPGIDTIDATSVDSSLLGHSYYGSSVTVLTDVGHLLRNEPLAQRVYLRPIRYGQASYWTFDPVMVSNLQSIQPMQK